MGHFVVISIFSKLWIIRKWCLAQKQTPQNYHSLGNRAGNLFSVSKHLMCIDLIEISLCYAVFCFVFSELQSYANILLILVILTSLYNFYLIFYVFKPVITGSFHLNQSDTKSLQLYRTLLNILAYLNCAVIWKISILLQIFSSLSLFSKFFGIIR